MVSKESRWQKGDKCQEKNETRREAETEVAVEFRGLRKQLRRYLKRGLMEVEEGACAYRRGSCCRQREQQVQRP